MAWVSPKVIKILDSLGEKALIEKIPGMEQEEAEKAVDEAFHKSGKENVKTTNGDRRFGKKTDKNTFIDDDTGEESALNDAGELVDEEFDADRDEDTNIDSELYEQKEVERRIDNLGSNEFEENKNEDEVSDEKISEALADYQWQITDSDTVGSYAQSVADKLGCSKEQVLKVIRNENENISENDSMAKVAGLKEDEEYKVGDKDIFSDLKSRAKNIETDGDRISLEIDAETALEDEKITKEQYDELFNNNEEPQPTAEDNWNKITNDEIKKEMDNISGDWVTGKITTDEYIQKIRELEKKIKR